jgi:FkbM family methyltransferase
MKKFIKSIIGKKGIERLRIIRKSLSVKSISSRKEIELNKSFYVQFIKQGDLCFDVGANMGKKVQPLLEINARVVAIEPQEACQKYLRKKFNNRIILVSKGLGSKEETRDFYISDSNTISSFSKDWIDEVSKRRFKDSHWDIVKKVEITTLDRLIEQYGTPGFIKIDVEGFELEVLKGLSKPVAMICFEYTVPEQTQKAVECINTLESINPGIECNYATHDRMEFVLEHWESPTKFAERITGKEFYNSGFGDIYVRSKIFQN